MKKKKRIAVAVILGSLLAAMLYVAVTAAAIWNYGKVDDKRQADAAIVLGAAVDGEEVSPVFRERINHGIVLYQEGFVEYLIFTGGTGEGSTVSEAFAAKQYALEAGVPEGHILIEESSRITEENLANAGALMEEAGMDTALIVSDPLHMMRAMEMAKDFGLEACASPTPTSMYRSLKTQLPFLAREVFYYTGYRLVNLFW